MLVFANHIDYVKLSATNSFLNQTNNYDFYSFRLSGHFATED